MFDFRGYRKSVMRLRESIIFLIFTVSLALFTPQALANNITVSNVTFGPQNTSSHYMPILFNITWQNAWKDSSTSITAGTGNYDAVWVFIKYSIDGVTWNHATLGPISGGTSTTGGAGGTANPTNFYGGTATVGGTSTKLDVLVPTDNKGAFVQIASTQTSAISGTLISTGAQFLWNYGGTGGNSVSDNSAALASVQVMAIEMVYVPTSSFYVGDSTTSSLTGQFCQASATTSLQITGEGPIALGNGLATGLGNNNASGMLVADDFTNTVAPTNSPTNLPDNSSFSGFPKGYKAFYMMKYNITQGQWRDFLNTLTRTQQNGRILDAPANDGPQLSGVSSIAAVPGGDVFVMANSTSAVYRNGVELTAFSSFAPATAPMTFSCYLNAQSSGVLNGSDDGEWVAANYLSWMDAAAYAAWAGLRPFTELEYEKAARGSVDTGTANEFAWGTTSITAAAAISNAGTSSEASSTAGSNCVIANSGTGGPLRVGSFATSGSTRVTAGASYWGIMNLSGNVWQQVVTVGNATGRSFIGSNGTGVLAADGNATNSDWPGYSSGAGEVNGALGSGLRGGDWWDQWGTSSTVAAPSAGTSTFGRISDRFAAVDGLAARYYNYNWTTSSGSGSIIVYYYWYDVFYPGARFARTAP